MTVKCKICGKEFEAQQRNHNLCSDECRKISIAKHRKAYLECHGEEHQRRKQKQLEAKAIKPNEAAMLAKNVDMMSEFLKNQSFGASQAETLLKNAQ